ncbi:chaperone protein ClpB1-like isoform X2 [Rhododendron vialii]|uniref:chaperone protein ClpB1-like isoform X2 n=1 Tax=Rhododendron vialii TaxID=182163 RepID=UPI00265E1210|nr:chaperone protein ClpB1-like isoform X2 [Rhododendron vialii]
MDRMVTEILRQKDELETAYGVEIHSEALYLACRITIRHSNVLFANEEVGSDNFEDLLQKKAFGLVKNACLRLRLDLDTDVEENTLDTDEYLLCRALVELEEIKKEKDHGKRLWIPRVEREYKDLMDKWDKFMKKSKPIVMGRNMCNRRGEELQMLEQLRQGLVSFMQEAEVDKKTELKPIFGMAQCFSSHLVHENHKQNLAVTPRLVAEVASPLTGFPASWLLCGSNPPLQDLESRLAERVIGQDHVSFLISRALRRRKSGAGPLGSFLFLYGSGRGRTEQAKALAKQLFDDDKLLTEVDMLDYGESDSASRLFGAPSSSEECGAGGLLTEAVKKRPFGVILLDNVDRAHPAVIDLLITILIHGRVLDGVGNTVYFTNTLIVMTSNVVDYMFEPWGCRCWSQEGLMKDKFYNDPPPYPKHRCAYISLLMEARKYFKPELFEKLDEVIVFNVLSYEESMAVGRLQLRDIASSIKARRLILYPSEAALRGLVVRHTFRPYGGQAMKVWLEENVVPMLFGILANNETDEMLVVYIDALMGTKVLSYRSEKRGTYLEDLFLKHFKESLKEFRIMYCKEKERVNKIYVLRQDFFTLMNLLNAKAVVDFSCVADTVQKLLNAVDDLISNAVHALFVLNLSILETSNRSNEETEPLEKERPSKRPMNQVQGLSMLLTRRVVRQNQAIELVAEALLKSIRPPHDLPHQPTRSLLFLGLTSVGLADLVRSLAENFVSDDGTELLIYVDLSKYSDSDSLFRLLYEPLEISTGHGQHGFLLLELVQMRPHSILVFSQVEQAHISVFSALLSVLDQGTLCDLEGHTVDFRHTVVIFASDMGNSKVLAQLVGHADPYDSSIEVMQQKKSGFRSELLNRIDEIVCFHPFAGKQLRKVARLSMRDGPHLVDGRPLTLSTSLMDLFCAAGDPVFKRFPSAIEDTVSFLAKGLINCGSDTGIRVVVNQTVTN